MTKHLSEGGTLRITMTVKDNSPGQSRWSPAATASRTEVTVDLPAIICEHGADWQDELRGIFLKQAENAARAAWGQYFDSLMSRWDNPAADPQVRAARNAS